MDSSSGANSFGEKANHKQSSSKWKYVGYFIFTLCASLYLLPFMRILLAATDEGTLINGAVRIVHGQVFARDFLEAMGPGTFYWLGVFFKLFGVTFLATRICLFVTSLGTGLLIYFLSRRVCSRYQLLPCIILVSTYFSMLWPTISHHVDSNLFAIASVACMVFWQERRSGILLIAAGVLAGITTSVHQPKGGLLLVSILLWLWIRRRKGAAPMAALGLVTAAYCGFIGIVLLYFFRQGALRDLVYVAVVWPYGHYGPSNVVPYAQSLVTFYWRHWVAESGLNWSTGMASVLITPFLFVAALPVSLPLLGARSKWKAMRPEVALYWLCGWALWLSEIHRKDISHLVFGSPLLIILLVHLLMERREKVADVVLQLLFICAGCLACFNLFLVLTAHSLTTRVGTVAVFKDDPVLTFLDEHVAPGEEIFAYPYCPMYYFLSSTVNPTHYSILVYQYNISSQFEEVVRTLEQHRVKYVIWDTGFEASAACIFFPAAKRTNPKSYIVEPYLESHYKVVKSVGGIHVMERNSEGRSN
ncbi:MAG TPA: glycosyltransferase family 39 protein, partial [Ktedonobacteraceae bacterium]